MKISRIKKHVPVVGFFYEVWALALLLGRGGAAGSRGSTREAGRAAVGECCGDSWKAVKAKMSKHKFDSVTDNKSWGGVYKS